LLQSILRPAVVCAAVAQLVGIAAAEHYRFRQFGPDEGLNTTVTALVQDRAGFLWAGSANGLYRYDGARFQRFGADEGLPNAAIRAIKEAPDGTLWIVTGRGLACFRRARFETVETGVAAASLHSIDIGTDGRVYLGYENGVLSAIPAPGRPADFRPIPGALAEPTGGVLVERTGKLWFGCGQRLCLLESAKVRALGETSGLPPDRWQAIFRDRSGNLWIRSTHRLYVQSAGAERFVARDQGLPPSSGVAIAVAQDRSGHILVSTDNGLARWAGGQWRLIGKSQGLEYEAVTAILEDREGSIWMGVWGAGVVRWPGADEWTNWTSADGLPHDTVWSIVRHPSGTLWAGTDRGVVRFQEGVQPRVWTVREGLAGDRVKSLIVDGEGAVWAACQAGGVSRIDPRTAKIRSFDQRSGLADERVTALYLDAENQLWVSTGEGLYRSDPLGTSMRFHRISPPATNDRTVFYRFHRDRQNRLWVGSTSGLLRYDRGAWMRFSVADGLKTDSVNHIAETSDGAIWISYREPVGVARLTFSGDAVHAEHFTQHEGLTSDYVLFLGVDSRGQLWVGTDRGAVVRTADTWHPYTHEDGLASNDCAANSFLAEEDGVVWVGTLKGMSRFRPTGAAPAVPLAPAVITAVRFGNWVADPAAGILRVPYPASDFQVAFSGLSLVSERNVRFRYRLNGWDDHWVEGPLRDARYSSLPPGQYRFEVFSRSLGGPWSPAPAVVSFSLLPPWWGTWWCRGFVGAAAILSLLFSIRVWLRRIRRENQRLERAVRERTTELELQKELVERQRNEIEALRHATPVAPAATGGPPGRSRTEGGLRILLVEDNPVNQKLAQRAIEKMGHNIVVADNGLRALQLFGERPFDLVLMDLQMPEMDGFETTAGIRQVETAFGRHTPVIAMTAHAMHGDRELCLRAGMDDYLSKPVDLQALARMIERYRAPTANLGNPLR
jgi:ligand-binding sensor domain-containing protein/ActR/RegA family two-component response regulator